MSTAPARTGARSEYGPASPSGPQFSERAAYLTALAVFGVAAIATLYFNRSMSGGMRMPGNWTMSMMWVIMPGQTWFAAALMFVGMWLVMMVAMMLPSTLPMLLLHRRAMAFRGDPRLAGLTIALGTGYFLVWTLFGVAAYAGGRAMALVAMSFPAVSRTIPLAAAAALILAGVYQLTPWKSACLKHCRDPLALVAHHLDGGWRGALALGLHHGAFCAACCWALMLIQLVLGVMSLAVMVVVALVIALEKLLSHGEMVARFAGAASILSGIVLAAMSARKR
jgi:predicted metal-binding membrane protein